MGASVTKDDLPQMSHRRLTIEEKTHLIVLCSTAGTPSIMHSAIRSGDVFDPIHMKHAMELRAKSAS